MNILINVEKIEENSRKNGPMKKKKKVRIMD